VPARSFPIAALSLFGGGHEEIISWKPYAVCNLYECHRACCGYSGEGSAASLTAVQLVRILSWRKSRWGVDQRGCYNVIRPNGAPTWQLRAELSLLFPER
jgi:hypothetical protein